MPIFSHLSGVFAAALTPIKPNGQLDLDTLPQLFNFLSSRGCHGALLCGTTGEGPSFAPGERRAFWKAAVQARPSGFKLLAGTGTPSLTETIQLTRLAFNLGFDGVVTLPPYYFRKIGDDGLFAWFAQVLSKSVPAQGAFLGYHIPAVSGVGLSIELLARLKDAFPTRFAGIKDSSGSAEFSAQLGGYFGKDLLVLTGNDRLLSQALKNQASGCITAMATLISPALRDVWDAHQNGQRLPARQAQLDAARDVLDRYPPAAPLLKALLHRLHNFPLWNVRPPFLTVSETIASQAEKEFLAGYGS